jgi:BCD family chlorophyll transporter-like MFS transporter
MVALPLVFAPLRTLIGFKSDNHSSLLGWKRVPYIWFGTLMLFGGLAILPFALLVMTGGGTGPAYIGHICAGFGFLLVGAGMHTTQTAGLALATDLAPDHARPRVVALLYVMLLFGAMISAVVIGRLLIDFSPTKLVQIVQGAAALTMILNVIALWKQEPRNRAATAVRVVQPVFREVWAVFIARPKAMRLLVSIGLGAAAFNMQDVLIEPYGGQILGLSGSPPSSPRCGPPACCRASAMPPGAWAKLATTRIGWPVSAGWSGSARFCSSCFPGRCIRWRCWRSAPV